MKRVAIGLAVGMALVMGVAFSTGMFGAIGDGYEDASARCLPCRYSHID